ncbi:MAG: PAS domain S-box protein [Salinarimonadaceae bacterium]|nr:MAG: PAS domain S-box protein [Salinarimonadaceae bacterium]
MSLATRLLLIVILAVLPALLLGAYTEYSARQAREAEVRRDAVRLANQVADEVRQIIVGVQRLAMTLSRVPEVAGAARPGVEWSEPCARLIGELARDYPGGIGVGVANANAELVCAASRVPGGTRITGDHFSRAMESGRFTVGGYGEGPDGTAFLSFAYPLRDDDAPARGALVVGLRLDWLSARLQERFGRNDSSISIADRNLVYLLRLPQDPVSIVGQAALPEHRALVSMVGLGAVEADGVDGIRRVGAIRAVQIDPQSLEGFDLLVGYGISKAAAFGPIDAATRNGLLLLGLSLLLAFAAAWIGGRYLVRPPVARLLAAAARWREGDYSARVSGVGARGEFAELASAFNLMAESVADRTQKLRSSEERFRTLAALVPTFVWFADRSGTLLYANQRWYEFSGVVPAEGAPAHWLEAVHPEDVEHTESAWKAAVADRTSFEAEFRVRRHDGAYHWVLGRAEPLRDHDGEVTGWFGSTTDIDRLKRADEHRSLLVDELNHRVKNTLATVQSLAAQSLRSAADPVEGQKAFSGRLIALSRAHDVLTRGYWKSGNLREVVQEAATPFDDADARQISIDGPEVEVEPRLALALSMALHELLTNAAKYGALTTASGRVELNWSVTGDDGGRRLRLTWRESGGPPVKPPTREGFGSRLIQGGLSRELGGEVSVAYEPEGVVCTFDLPLGTSVDMREPQAAQTYMDAK